jgi:hypothetical protein
MNYCESCFEKKSVRWCVVDDNMEVELCKKCRDGLKSHCKVELIKL